MTPSPPFVAPRRGFTLVEMLVVTGIIAVLAALVVPAVVNARTAARTGAIRAEIEMLNMALMNYKAEYGSFPPCTDNDRAKRHLQRLFPRCNPATEIGDAVTLTPEGAIRTWLMGYTSDPSSPMQPQASRRSLYAFDASRPDFDTTGLYKPERLANSPFVYIDSAAYGTVAAPASFVVGSGTYQAETRVVGTGTSFFNPDTFQILCAGVDGQWNTPDDLSNFWRRTRGDASASGQ